MPFHGVVTSASNDVESQAARNGIQGTSQLYASSVHNTSEVDRDNAHPRQSISQRIGRALTFTSRVGPNPNILGGPATTGRAGIDAEIWQTYVSEAATYDKSLIASWNEDLDVLLIFAGLLSAILATFIVESRRDLQEDYSKTSADLLRALLDQSRNVTLLSDHVPVAFIPARNAVQVNALWFASLGCSLVTALAAMLGKQWVAQYTNTLLIGGAHLVRARHHQSALGAVERWQMSRIIRAIPVFMHIALFLFFIGLVMFIWGDSPIIVGTVSSITLGGVLFYLILTILPSICPDCPFGTPFSYFIPRISPELSESMDHDTHSRNKLDTECLAWLMQSTDPAIVRSAAMTISGLEGTDAQLEILGRSGAFDAVVRALVSCTVQERGLLVVKQDSLDEASLLLFAASRLLNVDANPSIHTKSRQALIDFLRRLDLQKVVGIRQTLDAADFAAATWCIVALNSLRHVCRTTHSSGHLASEFIQVVMIPDKFNAPALGRLHKDLLSPAIQLASSTPQENCPLFTWAVQAMFVCWRSEGLTVALGDIGSAVVLRAATTTISGEREAGSVLATIVQKLQIQGPEMVSTTAIGPLFDAIQLGDPQVTVPAIRILEQFDVHTIITTGALQILTEAINSHDRSVVIRVISLLGPVSSQSSFGARAIVEAGLVDSIVKALDSHDNEIVDLAHAVLSRTLTLKLALDVIVSTGVINRLVKVLELSPGSTPIIQALQMISSHEQGVVAVIAAGAVYPLIAAAQSPKSAVAVSAMTTLHEICRNPTGVSAVVSASVVHKLATISVSSDITVALAAHSILIAISSHDVGQLALFQPTIIRSFMEVLTKSTTSPSPDWASKKAAFDPFGPVIPGRNVNESPVMGIMKQILLHERGVTALIEAGAVEPLVAAVSSVDPHIQYTVATILSLLSEHTRGVNAIVEAGIIERIIAVLKLPEYLPKHAIMVVLEHIARTESACEVIVKSGAVTALKDVLNSDDPYLRGGAFGVFNSLLDHNKCVEAVFSAGVEAQLVELAKLYENYDMLSKLTSGVHRVGAALEAQILEYVVDNMQSGKLQSNLEEGRDIIPVMKILLAISDSRMTIDPLTPVVIPAITFEFFRRLSQYDHGESGTLASKLLAGRITSAEQTLTNRSWPSPQSHYFTPGTGENWSEFSGLRAGERMREVMSL